MNVLNSILSLFHFNRKNWKAVSLCFFAATIFWFFNALNKNYTTTLTFPLEFDYDRENYIAVTPLPSNVKINVTGIGWDLFRRSIGLKLPSLVIPLDRPSEVKRILATPPVFANQLERFQINFVLSDTLRIALEPKEERWIKLRLDPNAIAIRKGFKRTSEPVLKPDSIFVQGPWPLVNSFIEPVHLRLGENNIDEDYSEDVEVEFLQNDLITRNPPTVLVEFKVDKLIELEDSIPLTVINYPKGANPYLGVKALACRFAIPESFMDEYQPDSVRAVIDLQNFTKGMKRIRPLVKGLPPYSEVFAIDSIFVQF
jgi:hypothetical protein